MSLEGFSCKNELHTKKYTIKGLAMSGADMCFYIEHKKELFYFIIKNTAELRLFNLVSINEKSLGEFDFYPQVFYKPLGYMEAAFWIGREMPDFTYLKSNCFIILENKISKKCTFKFTDFERFFELDKKEFDKHLSDEVWVPDECIVHNGKMHADDILSVALLKYVNKDIKFYRTREIDENFKGVIVDVGGGRYDHHELDKPRIDPKTNTPYLLPDGRPEMYASFGLLAKDIIPGYIGTKNFFTIDHQIIRALDSADNYGTFSDLAYFFSLFNPSWDEEVSEDEKFGEAVEYGLKFITEMINKELARQKAVPFVQSCLSKMENNILVLSKRAPWVTAAKKSSAIFTIYPTDDNLYALQCVPDINADARTKKNKKDMPESWFETPPKGLKFLHKSLYIATFETLDDAYNAALSLVK